MLRWLKAFVRRELVADVPAELSLCLDCGKLACSEGEFRDCARRKERAAELALDRLAPEAAREGETNKGADICQADAAAANERLAEIERRPLG